jgi:hypothetical protein
MTNQATGTAIVQPIQLLQDLYIELNNSLAETESNEIFYIIETDPTGTIRRHTNMITHYVPDLTAQRVIDNTTQLIQRVQASGAVLSQCIKHPVPFLHSRLYYSLTITYAQDQSCSNQEQ